MVVDELWGFSDILKKTPTNRSPPCGRLAKPPFTPSVPEINIRFVLVVVANPRWPLLYTNPRHFFFLGQIQDHTPLLPPSLRSVAFSPFLAESLPNISSHATLIYIASLVHFRCPRIFTHLHRFARCAHSIMSIRHRPNSIRHYYPLIIISI